MGPTNVITAMGDRNVYLAYYLQCEGENPMQSTYEEFKAIYNLKERESVSSEGSAAPAGDEPATWHGSSVEVDDLWPGTTAPAQEVPPRSLEL